VGKKEIFLSALSGKEICHRLNIFVKIFEKCSTYEKKKMRKRK